MQAHGHYQLQVEHQKLLFKAYGSWNYTTTVNWVKDCKQLINKLKVKPWGVLADLTEWELVTPDVSEYIYEFNVWLNEQNLKYFAVVYNYALQKQLLLQSHQPLRGIEIKYCRDHEEANHWLDLQCQHFDCG